MNNKSFEEIKNTDYEALQKMTFEKLSSNSNNAILIDSNPKSTANVWIDAASRSGTSTIAETLAAGITKGDYKFPENNFDQDAAILEVESYTLKKGLTGMDFAKEGKDLTILSLTDGTSEIHGLTREELSRMDVGEIFDQIKDKTSDTAKAFRRMVENIEEAEGSSKLVGASLDKLDALQKKANRNPKHYVTKAQKANTKKWKPSGAIYNKLFGRSKNIVMVKDNDGIIKPMTVKNAKKFGKV